MSVSDRVVFRNVYYLDIYNRLSDASKRLELNRQLFINELEHQILIDKKLHNLSLLKYRQSILEESLQSQNVAKKQQLAALSRSQKLIARKRVRQKERQTKLASMSRARDKLEDLIQKRTCELSETNKRLKTLRCYIISQLSAVIFPIQEVSHQDNSPSLAQYSPSSSYQLSPEQFSPSAQNVETGQMTSLQLIELDEAIKTQLVGGAWISRQTSKDNSFLNSHCIVASLLPDNGEYTTLSNFLHSKYGKISVSDGVREDDPMVHCIWEQLAALTFLTQLLNVLSSVLAVRLPFKLCYSVFARDPLRPRKFHEAVNKLNLNILYLAFSQKVPSSSLRSHSAAPNLLNCISSNEALGESTAFAIDEELFANVDDLIREYAFIPSSEQDIIYSDSSDSDLEKLASDWESLPTADQVPVSQLPIDNVTSTSTLVSSAVNSISGALTSYWWKSR